MTYREQLAHLSRVHEIFDLEIGVDVAHRIVHHVDDARGLDRRDHAIGVPEGERDGFFAENVPAGRCGQNHVLGVRGVDRGDEDEIHFHVNEISRIAGHRQSVGGLGQLKRTLCDVTSRYDLRLVLFVLVDVRCQVLSDVA